MAWAVMETVWLTCGLAGGVDMWVVLRQSTGWQ